MINNLIVGLLYASVVQAESITKEPLIAEELEEPLKEPYKAGGLLARAAGIVTPCMKAVKGFKYWDNGELVQADFMNGDTILYSPCGSKQILFGQPMEVKWTVNDEHLMERTVEVGILDDSEEFIVSVEVPYNAGQTTISKELMGVLGRPEPLTGYKFKRFYVVLRGLHEYKKYVAVTGGRIAYGPEYVATAIPYQEDVLDTIPEMIVSNGTLDYVSFIMSILSKWDLSDKLGEQITVYDTGEWIVRYVNNDGVSGVNVLQSLTSSLTVVVYRPTITESTSMSSRESDGSVICDDWVTNMSLRDMSCEGLFTGCTEDMTVHLGFLTEVLYTLDDVTEQLREILVANSVACVQGMLSNQILFTGFSQGAALASLAIIHIKNQLELEGFDMDHNQFYIIVGGTPPIGNHYTAEHIEGLISESNRQRYHLAFPKIDETGGPIPQGVTVSFNVIPEETPFNVVKASGIRQCMGPTAPEDVIAMRNWEASHGQTPWYSGDLIGELQIDCKSDDEAYILWGQAVRRNVLMNPQFVHFDNTKAQFPGTPPIPQTGKGRHELYHDDCSPYIDGHVIAQDSILFDVMMLCHNPILYLEAMMVDSKTINGNRLWSHEGCGGRFHL